MPVTIDRILTSRSFLRCRRTGLSAKAASSRAEKQSLNQKLPMGTANVRNQSRKAAGSVTEPLENGSRKKPLQHEGYNKQQAIDRVELCGFRVCVGRNCDLHLFDQPEGKR